MTAGERSSEQPTKKIKAGLRKQKIQIRKMLVVIRLKGWHCCQLLMLVNISNRIRTTILMAQPHHQGHCNPRDHQIWFIIIPLQPDLFGSHAQ